MDLASHNKLAVGSLQHNDGYGMCLVKCVGILSVVMVSIYVANRRG
jgi:hypothetical protein